jgi:hypothetical protein
MPTAIKIGSRQTAKRLLAAVVRISALAWKVPVTCWQPLRCTCSEAMCGNRLSRLNGVTEPTDRDQRR